MSGTYWSQPNQQVVRDGDPVCAGGMEPEADDADAFDPGAHTVAEVEAYLDEHPDERDVVLEAERAGKSRTTLVNRYSSEGDAEDD